MINQPQVDYSSNDTKEEDTCSLECSGKTAGTETGPTFHDIPKKFIRSVREAQRTLRPMAMSEEFQTVNKAYRILEILVEQFEQWDMELRNDIN
tara:strand:- start:751 stop:1032 length:282 start_codon:yes stop_codon:yes gene_type:complete